MSEEKAIVVAGETALAERPSRAMLPHIIPIAGAVAALTWGAAIILSRLIANRRAPGTEQIPASTEPPALYWARWSVTVWNSDDE